MKHDELEKKLAIEIQQQEMEYNMDMTRVTMEREHWWTPNCRCSLSFLRTLQTMLHCDLYQSCGFNCLTAAVFFYSLGYSPSLIYLVDRATDNGISADKAFWFLSAVGASNTLGRVVCGILPCVVPLNICWFIVCTTAFAGAVTIASNLCYYYWFQMLYCVLYGFNCGKLIVQLIANVSMDDMSCHVATGLNFYFLATNIGLKAVITVELFGIENLNNVFGIQLMFSGVAMLMGPVIGGGLYDYTNIYFWTYVYSGICIVCCAVFTGLAKLLRRREIKREKEIQLLEEVDSITV